MDPGSPEQQIADLRERVLRLEAALRRQGIDIGEDEPVVSSNSGPAAKTEATPRWPRAVTSSGPVATPPGFLHSAKPATHDDRSLESRIGSQWFNRVGILAVLIGMAWFLKLAIDNHWIGPAGRVIIGLIAGAGLIAWSERFRNRGFGAFSYSLKAVGSGIL